MFQVRMGDNSRSKVSRHSCAFLVVELTSYPDSMSIAAISCLSSVQVARKFLSPVECLRATYMKYHIVTAALVRQMNQSKGWRVFYRKFNRRKPWQAVPRRKKCGRLYIKHSFTTILRKTYPIHVGAVALLLTTLQSSLSQIRCTYIA